jgi:transposase-like protein
VYPICVETENTMSSKMNGSRRRYTREFKEEAVQLSERGDTAKWPKTSESIAGEAKCARVDNVLDWNW